MVGNLEQQLVIMYCCFGIDAAAGIAEFYGIAKKVDNYLAHPLTVDLHLR